MLHKRPSAISSRDPSPHLCVTRHTCVPNQCEQGLFQLACALGPSLRLGLLHALDTPLDRCVVLRDGVVILGRGVTVLRYHVWAMSAPRVLWAHFMLCLLCFGCAVGEPTTASSLSGARVHCGY